MASIALARNVGAVGVSFLRFSVSDRVNRVSPAMPMPQEKIIKIMKEIPNAAPWVWMGDGRQIPLMIKWLEVAPRSYG